MTSVQNDDLSYPYDHIPLMAHQPIIDHILAPDQRRQPVWIFAGKEGIGKATTAFHVAARLLSYQSEPLFGDDAAAVIGEARDEVKALIRAGSHPDFKYIHAQGEGGNKAISTDQVREMSSFLSMTPSLSQWRVVIVDALDNINVNGANAMLKTLEEPPQNTMIILISHASGAILPTIRSRARLIRLQPLNDDQASAIIASLYPEVEPDWLAIMVAVAYGSPGRAEMLAETGSIDLYADTLTQLCQDRPDLLTLEHLATQWGPAGIRNRARRHMAYILFDRLITKAVRLLQEQGQGETSPSQVALEISACQHMLNRRSQYDLAEIHQQFLSDWRDAEALNLAMMPVMLSLLRALT